jgi:hypothetical protein
MADNVDQIVSFKLDGVTMERRLVERPVEDMDNEINVKSPVGQVLRTASAGDFFTVAAPGGDLVVEVLRVDGVVYSGEPGECGPRPVARDGLAGRRERSL